MFSRLIASFLITFSVFLGAELSNKYPDFLQKYPDFSLPQHQSQSAAIIDLKPGAESHQPQTILLPRLPESANIPQPDIGAKAAISIKENGQVLFNKNTEQPLPIASLTKLLTALVVFENLSLSENIKVSKAAVDTYGEMGELVVNEELSVESLLYIMLVDSSNDAAIALSGAVENRLGNGKTFPDLMNVKARELGMINSRFSDPAGLNPDNLSSAADLVKLVAADFNNQTIKKILGTDTIDIFSTEKLIKHRLKNTNKLLNKTPGVIGGKTGYTEEAGECMILIAETPKQDEHFFVVLLGSAVGMRFVETEKLVDWTRQNYGW